MRVSSGWLKEHLRRTILTEQEIVNAVERSGLEVEQVIASNDIDKNIIVGLVKKVIQHPNAERLHLVDISIGESDFRIVCGAPNVREGIKVAVAQIGAVLPGGDRIQKAKLRGEVSEGMLCSELELNIGKDHNGILEVDGDVAVGTPLCDIYPADSVIEVKTPANRFDVQSIVGIAREVAAMTSAELTPLSPPAHKTSGKGPEIGAKAEAARYMLASFQVSQVAPSPSYIAARLRSAGMRAISPVVDVTNYVMLELGQPLHAFDAAKVKLPVTVRHAAQGEQLITLDGVTRKLSTDDLVIVDQDGPIALAGVMGGLASEVSDQTTEILLESAVFDGISVRKSAKRHGLRSEASARFERGLPVELPPLAMDRSIELLQDVAAAKLIAITDQQNVQSKKRRINLQLPRVSEFVGAEITSKEIVDALSQLQIVAKVEKHSGETNKPNGMLHKDAVQNDIITVDSVPWWRSDINLPEDLIEEIVRVIGYDKIPATIPSWRPLELQFDKNHSKRRRVKDLMFGAGLFEVMTYSFVSAEQLRTFDYDLDNHLKLKNPLSSEQAYLRSSLLSSHVAVLARNRTYAKQFGFYEISKVFIKKDAPTQPDEPLHLAVTVTAPKSTYARAKGVMDALADELNIDLRVDPKNRDGFAPGRSGLVQLGGNVVGWIGQIHPAKVDAFKIDGEVSYFELDLSALLDAHSAKQFTAIDKFPTIQRDIAILLPTQVTWQSVVDSILPNRMQYVETYLGKELPAGYKGLTVRLVTSNPNRTPTEAEAVDFESKVFGLLERKLGAKRRD